MGKYRIISFDGGGMKGALSIKAFQMLVQEIPELLEKANLIAGTSTGGLISLGLCAGKTPEDLVQMYADDGPIIFDPFKLFGKETPEVSVEAATEENPKAEAVHFNPKEIIFPKYNNKKFKELLEDMFKDTPTLGALKKNVLVTTFQINNPEGWRPLTLSNLRNSEYLQTLCVDAALNTSAAPTYFPVYKGCADGGVFANNPSMVAVSAALDKHFVGANLEDIRLLSLGTGSMVTYKKTLLESDPWGILQWLNPKGTEGNDPQPPLLGALMDGVSMITHYECTQLFGAAQYSRLNIPLSKPYPMDDWEDVNQLFECAENYPAEHPREWNGLVAWVKEFFL